MESQKALIVEWVDSVMYTDEQLPAEEITPSFDILSVGILVAENESTITMALCYMGDDQYRQIICIPKFAIRKRVDFDPAKVRKKKN